MNEKKLSPVIASLLDLAKLDATLARLRAEVKKHIDEIAQRTDKLNKLQSDHEKREKNLVDRRERTAREQRSIRDERDKLTTRRKSLATLGTYKLQQAAEREIEGLNRQLHLREEALLKQISELEDHTKVQDSAGSKIAKFVGELEGLKKELVEISAASDARATEVKNERKTLSPKVEPAVLSLYERVVERHPMDPVVAVANTSCAACFATVSPQLIVQISKGEQLVKCSACGRILFLPD